MACMVALLAGGCHTYDNFTTYFNTYYNAKRLTTEVEDEFDFFDEGKRVKPRVLVADTSTLIEAPLDLGETPAFLQEFVISKEKLQPVKTKVDSVIIKGSKILSKHPKSNYIDGTLFLMTKSYFYQSDWLQAQVKSQELIDNFPHSDFSPSGHLFLAKSQFLQKKYSAGEKTLSRTVDIAWGQENYDVLSEAFRLQAELALYQGNLDDALKPYRRAIAQADDNELRARWQTELASILYRRQYFKEAAAEFAKVQNYSPDVLAEFESELYRGAALARLGKFQEAGEIFSELERNDNYDEWEAYVAAERINMLRLQKSDDDLRMAEQNADTAYIGNAAIGAAMYGRGLDLFREGDYTAARKYFAKSKVVRSPVHQTAGKYYTLLNSWEEKLSFISPMLTTVEGGKGPDSMRATVAASMFELARIHQQLGNGDSALYYYENAVAIAPEDHYTRARYLYALSRSIRPTNSVRADSLLDLIVSHHSRSEYALEARVALGYTDAIDIDSVADLFLSGTRFRTTGEYQLAVRQFARLAESYPDSRYAPKSLYTAGWIFERSLHNNDSALYYYSRLMRLYPGSEYAREVQPSVLYAQALRNGDLPDTLSIFQDQKEKGTPGGRVETGEDPNGTMIRQPSKRKVVQPPPDSMPSNGSESPQTTPQFLPPPSKPSRPIEVPTTPQPEEEKPKENPVSPPGSR